jgi:hypothetical protein
MIALFISRKDVRNGGRKLWKECIEKISNDGKTINVVTMNTFITRFPYKIYEFIFLGKSALQLFWLKTYLSCWFMTALSWQFSVVARNISARK